MNRIILLSTLFSLCTAAVIPEESLATIINYQSSSDGAGNYKFSYETSNGITREEEGRLLNAGTEEEYTFVKGFYKYTDEEGKVVIVEYTADENGFHPSSAIPAAVRRIPANVLVPLGK